MLLSQVDYTITDAVLELFCEKSSLTVVVAGNDVFREFADSIFEGHNG